MAGKLGKLSYVARTNSGSFVFAGTSRHGTQANFSALCGLIDNLSARALSNGPPPVSFQWDVSVATSAERKWLAERSSLASSFSSISASANRLAKAILQSPERSFWTDRNDLPPAASVILQAEEVGPSCPHTDPPHSGSPRGHLTRSTANEAPGPPSSSEVPGVRLSDGSSMVPGTPSTPPDDLETFRSPGNSVLTGVSSEARPGQMVSRIPSSTGQSQHPKRPDDPGE